ncbi:uncharacterized protein CLUP02_15989 [Colletotrichum lupini]|uniref:Uncharacterized protein n=1 Tax=Colletotrichum lupini TaxID=145971 RepID=A0A9Q8WP24_9PEZI|nr:uncharacterized protein CLUP02_15989 [Colletotrichum lupini]UQC90459.1 hypothetical protein CLUP02_15989 [Colletotrichum lupini]
MAMQPQRECVVPSPSHTGRNAAVVCNQTDGGKRGMESLISRVGACPFWIWAEPSETRGGVLFVACRDGADMRNGDEDNQEEEEEEEEEETKQPTASSYLLEPIKNSGKYLKMPQMENQRDSRVAGCHWTLTEHPSPVTHQPIHHYAACSLQPANSNKRRDALTLTELGCAAAMLVLMASVQGDFGGAVHYALRSSQALSSSSGIETAQPTNWSLLTGIMLEDAASSCVISGEERRSIAVSPLAERGLESLDRSITKESLTRHLLHCLFLSHLRCPEKVTFLHNISTSNHLLPFSPVRNSNPQLTFLPSTQLTRPLKLKPRVLLRLTHARRLKPSIIRRMANFGNQEQLTLPLCVPQITASAHDRTESRVFGTSLRSLSIFTFIIRIHFLRCCSISMFQRLPLTPVFFLVTATFMPLRRMWRTRQQPFSRLRTAVNVNHQHQHQTPKARCYRCSELYQTRATECQFTTTPTETDQQENFRSGGSKISHTELPSLPTSSNPASVLHHHTGPIPPSSLTLPSDIDSRAFALCSISRRRQGLQRSICIVPPILRRDEAPTNPGETPETVIRTLTRKELPGLVSAIVGQPYDKQHMPQRRRTASTLLKKLILDTSSPHDGQLPSYMSRVLGRELVHGRGHPRPSFIHFHCLPAPAPPSASVLLPLHLRPAPTRKSGGTFDVHPHCTLELPHVTTNKPLFPNEFPTPSGNLTTAPAEARKSNLNQVCARRVGGFLRHDRTARERVRSTQSDGAAVALNLIGNQIVGWSCLCNREFLSSTTGSSLGTSNGDIERGNVVSWTTWYFIWVANINVHKLARKRSSPGGNHIGYEIMELRDDIVVLPTKPQVLHISFPRALFMTLRDLQCPSAAPPAVYATFFVANPGSAVFSIKIKPVAEELAAKRYTSRCLVMGTSKPKADILIDHVPTQQWPVSPI